MDSDLLSPSDLGFERVFAEKLEVTVTEETHEYRMMCGVIVEVNNEQKPPKEKMFAVKVLGVGSPFFVYKGIMNSHDYEKIKSEHGLFVDFCKFIDLFLNLLKKCKSTIEGSQLRFILCIDEMFITDRKQCLLKVIEVNDLRQMTHLLIRIHRCSEEEVRKVVTTRMIMLQEEKYKLERRIDELSSQLNCAHSELMLDKTRVEETKELHEKELRQIKENHVKDLAEEKERFNSLLSERQRYFQDDLNMKEKEFHAKKSYLEIQLHENSTLLSKAQAQITSLNSQNNDLKSSLQERETEVSEMRKENSLLTNEMEHLKSQINSKDTEIKCLMAKYRDVLKDFVEVSSQASTQQMRSNRLEKENEALEQEIQKCQKELYCKTETIEIFQQELMEAKRLVSEGKEKYRTVVKRCEEAADLMAGQEKCINDLRKLILVHQKSEDVLVKKNEELSTSLENLKKELTFLKLELSEKQKIIRTNENVISFLTKQVKTSKTDVNTASPFINTLLPKPNSQAVLSNHQVLSTTSPSVTSPSSQGSTNTFSARGYLQQQAQTQQSSPSEHIVVPLSSIPANATSIAASSYFTKKKSDTS